VYDWSAIYASDLTPRMVREEMEKRFSLEEEALGTKKYKSFIKDAIRATLVRPLLYIISVLLTEHGAGSIGG
jgi:hypothetical protein